MDSSALALLEKKVFTIKRPEPALMTMYILTSLLAFCAAPIVLVPLYFRYHTLWYRFEATGVSMGFGILFRREMQLTYARMQDIHLSQNIIERWLGIGTVTVQTAGSGASGNLSIEITCTPKCAGCAMADTRPMARLQAPTRCSLKYAMHSTMPRALWKKRSPKWKPCFLF
jgi:uncharacterized membrane protein YdbT with pleckstrin-like domain